jgi:hypothetical protein
VDRSFNHFSCFHAESPSQEFGPEQPGEFRYATQPAPVPAPLILRALDVHGWHATRTGDQRLFALFE